MDSHSKTNRQNNRGKSTSVPQPASEQTIAGFKPVRPLAARQFVQIMEHITDGLVVLDKDWRYVFVNQKAAEMLQRKKPSDLIGKHIWTEYPEGVGQPFKTAYEKAMREQLPLVFESHYEPWDLWFENRVYPSPEGLLILFTDITDRKRFEQLLEERQHLLQKILDTEPGIVYIYDLDERRNVYINRHWLSAFGYTPEETQDMGEELVALLFHPDDLMLITAHHENWWQAEDGEIRTIQYRVHAKTGDWHWLYSREAPFARDESGRVKQILGIAHDITDQKQMQEAILKEKDFSEAMLNSLPGIFYFFNDNGKFLRWNRNFEVVTGYSAEEIAHMHPLDFFDGQEKEYVTERIQQVFERGETDAEANFTTKNGELFPYHYTGRRLDIDGQPYLIGMGIDISERRRADMALRESEKQLSSIYDTVGDIIFQLAVEPEGIYRFTSANQAFFKTTGLSREMVLGKRVDEIIPEPSRNMVLQKYREAIETGKIMRWEEVSEYPTGTLISEMSIAPVFDDHGHCTHLVGAMHDITERKRSEQENRVLLHDLKERVKELTALHHTARLQQQEGADIPSVVRELVTLLPQAFQYPEMMVARIQLGESEAVTSGFTSLDFALRTEFMTADGQTGSIEVGYVQESPPELKGSFLVEERALINTLADMLRTFFDRKQAEEALRLSESRYRAVVEHQTEFIVRWRPDGVRTFVNEAYRDYFGLSTEQALSTNFVPLVVEEDQAAVQAKIARLISGEVQAETDTHRVINPDGSIGWQEWVDQAIYDENGQIVEFQSVGRDVTERKRTEEALAASETELRALFASMNDVVLVIDRDGVYRKIAPTNPNLLYKPPGELLGKSLRDVFPADRAEAFIITVQQVVETRETAHIEYPLNIDGQLFWFDASISPMDTDSTLWIARDITDRKQAEERLQRLNEELEQRVTLRTEELAAAMLKAQESDQIKSAFLATMSHELRTPLNSIIGFTGVLLQELAGPLNDEQAKQLNMTRNSARHLLALINDILDISKIEAGQLEIVRRPFAMREAIESVLRVVYPFLQKKNLQLTTSIMGNVGIINQDRRRVEQVLINLVNNAIKFTEQGAVEIECKIEDGWLDFSVRDSGIGIKPEDLQQLFKPFQQINTGLARSHEGTGLGLAICKHLITAMGGEITVQSQWGAGSIFTFTLPT
jgi:PAS domain S-box-containing protein